MRLIDADALKEALTNTQTRIKYKGVFTVDDVREFIDNAPTVKTYCYFCGQTEHGQIESDKPQGKWIRKVDEVGFVSHICSKCGAEIEVEDPIDDKFCFNCGAEMQKGKNDT